MSGRENPHDGHRERLRKKFLLSPNTFADHEILELLLFTTIPRINTNGIAHSLLRTFGSLEKVFSATKEELLAVEGIGEKSAVEIILFGEIYRRLSSNRRKPETMGFSFAKNKDFFKERFEDLIFENFLVVMLDSNMRKIGELCYRGESNSSVYGNLSEIAKSFALLKPKFVLIAHNHVSGNPNPSYNDDSATMKMIMLCNLHGIQLLDHVIVAKEDIYSYHTSGILAEMKKESDIDKFVFTKKENFKWIE